MCSSQRSQAFELATTTEQVLVHLFCFLLGPFLCAGPDRILIEPKQFINLKSFLLVTVQLINPFNAHLFASYWKKKQKLYMLRSAKNLLDKRFFLLFLLLSLLGQRKNWPIADLRVPTNDPRNNFGTRRPFSSYKNTHFQNEAKYKTFLDFLV